jgi:hypothetical protein
MRRLLLLSLLALSCSGCVTDAGPFVTDVVPNGQGGYSVKQCKVRFNPWSSKVRNYRCDAHDIATGTVAAPLVN